MAIYTTVGIAKESALILLDGCDDKTLAQSVFAELEAIPDVKAPKDFKLWSLNRAKYCAAAKIRLQGPKYRESEAREEIK
jgi:Co/Zn/Cd efflux system component